MRAIEEGLPVVRAANTGISAVIDAHGQITARIGLAEKGLIDAAMPKSVQPTLFALLGHFALMANFVCMLMVFGVNRSWKGQLKDDRELGL